MKAFKLKFKKWRYYFIPGAWRWLKRCNQILNAKETQEIIDKQVLENISKFFTCGEFQSYKKVHKSIP